MLNQSDKMTEAEQARVDQEKAEKPELPGIENVDKATASRLKGIIERVERLEEEKAGLAEDIKEIYGEAKATGFDVIVIRQIIRLRKIEVDKRRENEMLLETYKAAIGMV